jgi:hypothetical protein
MTCDRSVVFPGFLHQNNWPPRNNWNIVESGVKHHKPTKSIPQGLSYWVGDILYCILIQMSIVIIKHFYVCGIDFLLKHYSNNENTECDFYKIP